MTKNANTEAAKAEKQIEVINDWVPEVESLLKSLQKAGFKILAVDNGEDYVGFPGFTKTGGFASPLKISETFESFIEEAIATDESHLYVLDPVANRTRWLFLILGNSPGELVSDYSIPSHYEGGIVDKMDVTTSTHYEKWSLIGQPKKRGYYLGGKFVKVS